MQIQQFKKDFDPLIQEFLENKLTSFPEHKDKRVDDYLSYIKTFLAEGKRVRPYLAYLAYKAGKGTKNDQAIQLLVFLELFHAFALIHDDIMDNAKTRRTLQTAHEYIKDQVDKTQLIDSKHFGESQAILLGDLLLSWSFEILINNKDFDIEILQTAKVMFLKMIDEVILGQMIDLNITLENNVSKDLIEDKTILKTAYYSFVRPMQIGAILAGDETNQDFYEKLGRFIGIAFQTQDDLLDIQSDDETIHKTSFNDIEQGQQSFFTNYVFTNGSNEQKQILSDLLGKKISHEDKDKLRNVFKESKAITFGEKIINDNLNSAKKLITDSSLSPEIKNEFLELIALIANRKN